MIAMDFCKVSPYCLNSLVAASHTSGFHTSETIYDNRGAKLLSSGYKIGPETVDHLLNRMLQRPLETSLKAENAVTSDEIASTALKLLDEIPALTSIFSTIEEDCRDLQSIPIEPVAAILLTASRDSNPDNFQHTILVMMLSRVLGREFKLENHELKMLCMAAQVHDLGELYIDPICFSKKTRLSHDEWKSIITHPKIVQILMHEYSRYPIDVVRAVTEHHERGDGSGYPNKLVENQLSLKGQILIVAEVLSAMLLKPNFNVYRILLGFKMLPNEFPHKVVDALHDMVKRAKLEIPSSEALYDNASFVKPVISTLTKVQEKLQIIIGSNTHSPTEKLLAEESTNYLVKLKRSLIATGLDSYLDPNEWQALRDEPLMRLEIEVIGHETARRMRDISRSMMLKISTQECSTEMQTIIDDMAEVSPE